MAESSHLRVIAERRRANTQEAEILQERLRSIEAENLELEVTARWLQRLGIIEAEPEPQPPSATPLSAGDDQKKPTVPEMINAAIAEFIAAGLPGGNAAEIQHAITQRWGPVDPNHVRPTLWRMVKDRRITRDGFNYKPYAAKE